MKTHASQPGSGRGWTLLFTLLLVLLGAVLVAAPTSAQIGIETVFKDVTDVSFTTSCWEADSNLLRETDKCPFGQHAFGFEVSYRLKTIPLFGYKRTDTTRVVKEIHARNGSYDSIIDFKTTTVPTGLHILLELGLGYSQFSGFRSTSGVYELHGTLREIPAISLYASAQTADSSLLRHVGVYAGFRTGLIQARDFQVTIPANIAGDTVAVYQGEGQAFQIGWLTGLFVDLAPHVPVSLFVERANMYRSLPSIRWAKDGGKVPAFVPEELDFSGTTVSFGVQFSTK